MRSAAGGWGVALVLWASGCGPSPAKSLGTQELTSQESTLANTPFARGDVLSNVAHSGVRRLEFHPEAGQELAYRERISTDGRGRYAIEPVEALRSSILDWSSFELLQRSSQGFLFRYRDFAVRDAELFARNYAHSDLGQTVTVAGRICERFHVERSIGARVVYEVALDTATGLMLACDEFDDSGRLMASMAYEEVDFAPALENVVWHRSTNQEQLLDRRQNMSEQLQVDTLQPRLVPAGYALREVATVVDGDDRRWLKLTYVDGVEPLFFFQRLPLAAQGPGATSTADSEAGASIGGVAASRVVVFEIGAATAIQGTVAGFDLMVIGKGSQAELLDLIESALP